MGDAKRADAGMANQTEVAAAGDAGRGDDIVRKKRKLALRPSWTLSDLTISASLAVGLMLFFAQRRLSPE